MNPKPETRILWGTVALVILAAIGWPLYFCLGFWYKESQFTKPETLLRRTDYQAIRDACREMMAKHQRGELPGSLYRDDPRVPDAIKPLRPSDITITDEVVVVEMHSGSDHYGFFAYPDGSADDGREGGVRLINGLWIYGVDYHPDPGGPP